MRVSVIATVLNEGESIKRLLDSLGAQRRQPDEVVIVDGGSTDNTVSILKSYQAKLPLRIICSPGANISQGRNIAIAAAAGPVIASTDAGVVLVTDWLAELVKFFEAPDPPQVVSGFFVPHPETTFEVAMGATVLPMLADINPQTFLPSSRSVAFTKTAWQAVQGYPAWLDFCEDLIFDFNLKAYSGPFAFAPKAIAYFKPRSGLRAFFKQYYQYARGDGKADLWPKRHAIRYLAYLVALPLFVLLTILANPWWGGVGVIVGGLGLFYTPYKRLVRSWSGLTFGQKLVAIFWVPIIRITGDIAKMVGYPVGWVWRLRHLKQDPRLHWRQQPDQ